ncbi:glycoside hydrolase family 18 protein [Flagelloscypha sp. PMI_526]|nr:glycoside hydrolase family 18 protein [Flagelloscypha sp. PMI_526]
MFFKATFATLLTALNFLCISAYDASANNNLVVYWGQNSYGATHSDTANWQKDLINYCQDDTINVIPLAFLHVFFSTGGLPEINMANSCNSADDGAFAGTNLANCQFLADDIKTCQSKGKIVLLSLGGATGAASFTSDSQAETFAQTVWNLFFAGSSSTRPFGDAILDGVDLDIEGGGSTGWIAFVNKFRSLGANGSKKYYVTGAPQCPYPDAYMGTVLNGAWFDAVFVQFYNNYCAVANYPTNWNFADWHNWATTVSQNKAVKIFVGAPASSTAATSGYTDASHLSTILKAMKSQYSSFGGAMLWDASQAYANGRFDQTIKAALGGSTGGGTTTTTTTTTTSSTTTTTTTTTSAGSGTCSAPAWSATATYVGGDYVTYQGALWKAQWWTYGDTPGGAAGVWVKIQTCKVAVATATNSAASPSASASALPQGVDKSGVAPVKVPRPQSAAQITAIAEPTSVAKRSRFFKM